MPTSVHDLGLVCPGCGYTLAGLPQQHGNLVRCPECGAQIRLQGRDAEEMISREDAERYLRVQRRDALLGITYAAITLVMGLGVEIIVDPDSVKTAADLDLAPQMAVQGIMTAAAGLVCALATAIDARRTGERLIRPKLKALSKVLVGRIGAGLAACGLVLVCVTVTTLDTGLTTRIGGPCIGVAVLAGLFWAAKLTVR